MDYLQYISPPSNYFKSTQFREYIQNNDISAASELLEKNTEKESLLMSRDSRKQMPLHIVYFNKFSGFIFGIY